MARDLLMPSQRLMLSMLLMLMPHMLMDTHTLMDTDQSSVVLLLTQLVPPSPRDPHRVLARDQLMLSLSLLMPHMPHLSQSPALPMDMDLPDTESPRDTQELPSATSLSPDCTKQNYTNNLFAQFEIKN